MLKKSCPIHVLSYHYLPYLALSYRTLSYLILSCFTYLTLPYLVSYCFAYLIFSCVCQMSSDTDRGYAWLIVSQSVLGGSCVRPVLKKSCVYPGAVYALLSCLVLSYFLIIYYLLLSLCQMSGDIDRGYAWVIVVCAFLSQAVLGGSCAIYGQFYLELGTTFHESKESLMMVVAVQCFTLYGASRSKRL